MIAVEQEIPELEGRTAEQILEWAYGSFRRVAIVASFQVESSVLIHMAAGIVERPHVVTLDTGRLPEETHRVMERMQRRYAIELDVRLPDPADIAPMLREHGPNPFYRSVELRQRCCHVRKVRPLAAALKGYDAWITGLRRDQSPSRRGTPLVQADRAHGGVAKVAPLARWTHDQVWAFVARHGIDYHDLYGRGYRSIGCAPCTRAVGPDEHERAGRWWWEDSAVKECGLHWTGGVE